MNNLIQANIQGGLSNQLFIIATGLSLIKDNNDKLVVPISKHRIGLQGHNAIKYKNTLYRNLIDGELEGDILNFNQDGFNYKPIIISNKDKNNIALNGYFQSEKYFKHNEKYIRSILNFPSEVFNESFRVINEKVGRAKDIISIHVRRGDYLKFPTIHPVLTMDYYDEAVEYFLKQNKDYKFLIFSDDIEYCKNVFKNKNKFIIMPNQDELIDICCMSLCDGNIIANSTFSWWGAWFGGKNNVVAPSEWFGKDCESFGQTEDLIPNSWAMI